MTTTMRCYQCQRPIVAGQHHYVVVIDCRVPPPGSYVHLACWKQWVKENPRGILVDEQPKDVTP